MSHVSAPQVPAVDPLRAIGFVLAAMALFTMMDTVGKHLTESFHPLQIVWGRYFFFLAGLAPLIAASGLIRDMVPNRPGLQVLRGLCMLGSAIIFLSALSHLPLAQATVIGFASPFFVTLLSIPLLGEVVRARRWMAIAIGFCGVLIVVRPGSEAFQLAMLLPVASALCWAFGLIITRRMGDDDDPLITLLWTALVGLAGASAVVWTAWTPPDLAGWGWMAATGLLNIGGQFFLIRAFQHGDASVIAPFSYSTIVWAALFGYIAFATVPDAHTWLGSAVIIASGLYIWHRERVLARPVIVPNAAISAAQPGEAAE